MTMVKVITVKVKMVELDMVVMAMKKEIKRKLNSLEIGKLWICLVSLKKPNTWLLGRSIQESLVRREK